MAESLLPLGVEKLLELLVRDAHRFKEVDEQFNELKTKLTLLRSFLKDADPKKHTNELVKSCLDEIKEIVFDAEDIIETFLLKEELSKRSGIKRRLSFFIVDRRELGSEIRGISDRISKVINKMQTGGMQQITVHGGEYSHPVREKQREIRKTYPKNNESDLVGLEDNVEKIVGYLVEENNSHVVSIIGMGGIGKTTLAQQVFNHERIKTHFDGVVWVCISQQFTTKSVWQTILKKLSSKHDENRVSNMTQEELRDELSQLLETCKSLIVFDDMWKEVDWDRLKHAFPSKKGWKILLTSRNEKVGIHVDPTCVTFKPECLTIEDSWTLFEKIAFPRKDTSEYKVNVEMEEMGKKLIKHCGGLPLAVKVLGELFAAKHSLSEWKSICENIRSYIVGGTSFNEKNISWVYYILNLSFEELPAHLKHCFLYLAHFPEDYSIDVEKLSYYLEADGIQKPKYYEGLTIPEVADGYIEELVKRNMVISARDKFTSRFEKCQMHDIMREVCLRKAEDEKFVHVVDHANSISPCKSRRIAVHKVDRSTFHAEGLMKNPKLRSLLFIEDSSLLLPSDLLFKRLKLLRALDLSHVKFEGGKLHYSIGELIHLRYLSLYEAEVSHLPSSMQNLKLLLYLNIKVTSWSPIKMSNTLLNEMRELEYLHLPCGRCVHDEVKLEMGNLVKLVTLINFSPKYCSMRDLHPMTRLKTLKIFLFEEDGCSMETLSSSLSEWKHLESLTIVDSKYYDGLTISEVADGYIEELVKRNMEIFVKDELTSRSEKCQLHDTMREVCLRKTQEEKFVHVVDPANSMSPCKSPRISQICSSMWASALFSLSLPTALLFTIIGCLLLLFLCLQHIVHTTTPSLGEGGGDIDKIVDIPKVLEYIPAERTKITIDKDSDFPTGKYGAKSERFCSSDAKTNANLLDSKVIPPQIQVFINFRGVQLRNNFVGYLVHELRKREVNVFIDKYEKRGEDLSTLFKRIEESGIAIVVFSSMYAESKWCLDELVKIEERVHQGLLKVIPIFYKVSPTHVKKLKGEFGDHFRDKEDKYGYDSPLIKAWKKAIVSVTHKHALVYDGKSDTLEIVFVETIVKHVLEMLHSQMKAANPLINSCSAE